MQFSITVLPRDGIGPDVVDEAVKVLEAAGRRFGHQFELRYGIVGGRAIDETGTPLPDETLELCRSADAILFGAVGGPKWDDLPFEQKPERGLLRLRKEMDLFSNLRPAQCYC